MCKKIIQRCQARITEEEAAKHAADGKSKSSAVLSNSNKIVYETEVDAFESRSGCPCKKIIFRYETTQSRRKLNSERSETPRTILEKREKGRKNEENLPWKRRQRIFFRREDERKNKKTETFFATDENKMISIERANKNFFEKNRKVFFFQEVDG